MNWNGRYILYLLALIYFSACNNEENFITTGDIQLEFSLDTLRFDTVFTALGSATRSFRVYNRNDRPIRISNVFLEGRAESPFRINVDGLPGEAEEVIVWGRDSIWVFVEVTIDPDQPLSVSPFVIEEQVVFETNGNVQRVNLEAWGQNANYIPSRFNRGVPVLFTCDFNEFTWDDPKPYVVYGQVFIDSCTLNIPPGTQIYVHGGISRPNAIFDTPFNDGMLYTLENGRINMQGTLEEPIIVQGDRLETAFEDASGQWFGIILGKGSTGNVFEYTTIKNSIFGIYADSSSELTLKNAQIFNTANAGIFAFNSRIRAENTLVYNNAANSMQAVLGGVYEFDHCTLASYGVDASGLGMNNFFCYDDPLVCEVNAVLRLTANFRNSIIFGSSSDELSLFDATAGEPGFFNVSMTNCIVGVDDLLTQQDGLFSEFLERQCNPCIDAERRDPLFVDPNEDDYHLDSLSIAIGQGVFLRTITTDLEGNPRKNPPDIGCFERTQ